MLIPIPCICKVTNCRLPMGMGVGTATFVRLMHMNKIYIISLCTYAYVKEVALVLAVGVEVIVTVDPARMDRPERQQ